MKCITSIHSPILPRFPQPTTTTFMHQLTNAATTPLRFPNNASTAPFRRSCKPPPAAAATPSSLFLAAAVPPATSGDYTVLLQTGGLLFFLYLITNFLVPTLIFKDDGSDKDKEA
ncbi:PREDICTED: uncharacterized protein LOC109190371 [Ipomoea nil]|uniref:uncharacterized protein LOC109190371 n=1 Tax=Ipomoea nil TaxID=35883 RepID=UPI000900C939|nr:PREDICTED: uncharacterized protein LOC109190371 [Ipomoea nil]